VSSIAGISSFPLVGLTRRPSTTGTAPARPEDEFVRRAYGLPESSSPEDEIEQPVDTTEFSSTGTEAEGSETSESDRDATETGSATRSDSGESAPKARDGRPLTEAETDQLRKLKERDAEVRRHEQAHVAAGGSYVLGGPSYSFQTGPDGQQYAIGGSVQIDLTPVPNDPLATIQKAQIVRRAALAPADPSSQDRAVAAAAVQMEADARQQLQQSNGAQSRTARRVPDAESTEKDGDVQASSAVAATEPSSVNVFDAQTSRTADDSEESASVSPSSEPGVVGGIRSLRKSAFASLVAATYGVGNSGFVLDRVV